jgi:hypothetical protein
MAQQYVIFEWHTKTDANADWGSVDDYIVLPTTHYKAVLGLLEEGTTLLHPKLGARTLVQSSPPADPTPGMTWWDSSSGRMLVWYKDIDGGAWIDASPARVSKVAEAIVDQNDGTTSLKVWSGTQAELDVIDTALDAFGAPIGRDENTLYLIEQDEEPIV